LPLKRDISNEVVEASSEIPFTSTLYILTLTTSNFYNNILMLLRDENSGNKQFSIDENRLSAYSANHPNHSANCYSETVEYIRTHSVLPHFCNYEHNFIHHSTFRICREHGN
jgi:hypothetical protein